MTADHQTAPGGNTMTGYLGGAVATHVRVGGPLFSIFFPVFVGALLWATPLRILRRRCRHHYKPEAPASA